MKSYADLASYKRRAAVIGALGIAVVILAAWYSMRTSTKLFFEIRGKSLNQITKSLSAEINADEHALIRTPADMTSNYYRGITNILERCQKNFPEVVSAYTMRIAGGKASLIVSPPGDYDRNGKIDGDMEVRDQVGTPYFHAPTASMLEASLGTSGYNTEFTIDRWGTWLTACSPLKNFTDGVEGVVCVDEDSADVSAALKKQKLMTGALALIIVIVISGLLIEYVSTKIELNTNILTNGRREGALKRAIKAIEDTGFVALCSFDSNGTVRAWDRSSESIFGITAKEAVGNDIFAILSRVADLGGAKEAFRTVMQSKKPSAVKEMNFTNSKGEAKKILSVMSPSIEEGEVVEVIQVGVDVTRA